MKFNLFFHNGMFRQFWATYTASLTLIIVGTCIGWPSPVLNKFKYDEVNHFKPSEDDQTWMVALMYIGNILSPVPTGYLMDRFGRKYPLLILNIIPFISWLLIWFIHTSVVLFVARFLQGLWLGISYTIIPIYFAEIAEPAIRGSISTNFQTMIYVGVLWEYVIGPYVSYNVLAIVSFIFPVIFFITFPFMPETPYFYLMKSRIKDAEKSLRWLRSPDHDIDEELNRINTHIIKQREIKRSIKEMVFNRPTLLALMIVSVLSIFQRFSGIGTMMAYGASTLPPYTGKLSNNECLIVIGVCWIVFGFLSSVLADLLTRKALLIISSLGSAISLGLVGVWYYYNPKADAPDLPLPWAPFACFMVYGISYSVGVGPIVTTIKGEIFPSHVKGFASGLTTIVMALSSFIVNKIYKPIENGPGVYVNFFIYFVVSVLTILFTIFCVIETKGKTLEEIQTRLGKKEVKVALVHQP